MSTPNPLQQEMLGICWTAEEIQDLWDKANAVHSGPEFSVSVKIKGQGRRGSIPPDADLFWSGLTIPVHLMATIDTLRRQLQQIEPIANAALALVLATEPHGWVADSDDAFEVLKAAVDAWQPREEQAK